MEKNTEQKKHKEPMGKKMRAHEYKSTKEEMKSLKMAQ